MTQCNGSPAEEMALPYLMGELSEPEQSQFEEHYFSCEVCHEFLLHLKEIQSELRRNSGSQVVPQPMRIVTREVRAKSIPFRVAAFGALAAVILMAVILTKLASHRYGQHIGETQAQASATTAPAIGTPLSTTTRDTSAAQVSERLGGRPSETTMVALADVSLPGYHAPHLRGAEISDAPHAAFAEGMERYVAGDCAGAIKDLNQVPGDAAIGVAANLYAGLCQFKRKRLFEAQTSLEKVVAAGETPQLETADYYMAQTMLLRSDAAGGSQWLAKTIALHGDYEERARAELSRLPQGAGAR